MWWWWWWWWRKTIEMWFHGLPNLYKRATFYLFLSLHSAPLRSWHELVLHVPFAKNRLVERIASKGTRCLNTAMLVSPHFKQFRCLHRNVSGFALSILSPPWLLELPLVGKSGLGSISITSSFIGNLPSPREDRLVLFTMAACVYRNAGRHATHRIHQGNFYGFGAGFLFWCEQTESDRVWWSDDWRQ